VFSCSRPPSPSPKNAFRQEKNNEERSVSGTKKYLYSSGTLMPWRRPSPCQVTQTGRSFPARPRRDRATPRSASLGPHSSGLEECDGAEEGQLDHSSSFSCLLPTFRMGTTPRCRWCLRRSQLNSTGETLTLQLSTGLL